MTHYSNTDDIIMAILMMVVIIAFLKFGNAYRLKN
jgi:hypothetical protein